MKKIGIGIDYSNICKDFNTVYLDRDNTDPQTSKCMKEVLAWTKEFVSELIESFGYEIYSLNSSTSVKIDNIASKRFLFYSLEKEILLQNYIIQKEYAQYDNLAEWEIDNNDSVVIQNDEDGGGIYLFLNENSSVHKWITNKLQNFSLDEVPFSAK
ncbi:hypothetical protein HUE87_03665 [Candidatus Sulfurimonas marisnigri]|uniref:Uncharacterized protein n=1 Tax=Candidatus Sulfurimonas marisnigri TaxID=2740405 RepID=A0A7S7RR43_9BACT|nr:hypothetical protein [Candidatus Sulfurimonas marisnigri]QOY55346.1 hypothetical protein HUE87_03665 [Candidatus Sulfurimonas marisnigri]